jgi:hypothetical protein
MKESELSQKVLSKDYTPEQLNKIFLEFEGKIREETENKLGAYYRNRNKLAKKIREKQRLKFFNSTVQDINDRIAETRERLYKDKIL